MDVNVFPQVELVIPLPARFGKLLVRYRDGKVMGARLLRKDRKSTQPGRSRAAPATRNRKLERKLRADFRAYFFGKRVAFDYDVDTETFTPFQRAVWAAMREIPYGETRSYQWIAERIGKPRGSRAVGNACGKNPLLIIQPCHRVVGSGGKLGGFSAGLDLKKALLRLEGADL